MMKICDLHTHSVFSDGTYTPAEMIDEAIECGVSALALTDHNTIDGLSSFSEAAAEKNIEIVPGAEFSVDYNGIELHLLGLFIKPEYFSAVNDILQDANEAKEESNLALISSLASVGVKLDYDEIKKSTPNGRVNRANVARAMTEKGYTASVKEAFKKYLDLSIGHYQEPKRITSAQMIDFLRSIKSLPILAHPFLQFDEKGLVPFLEIAKKQGLSGIECYYSTYTEKMTKTSLGIAEHFGLAASGGTDFHGEVKPDIKIGVGKGRIFTANGS